MARHRACHALYKATSDIPPETLPNLCRALLKDPVAISHFLALEFWGQRVARGDWKPYAIRLPDDLRTEVQSEGHGVEVAGSILNKHELDALEKIMHEDIRLCVEDCKSWREKIEKGDDGALKGLLSALCPNLQTVRFVGYAKPRNERVHADENAAENGEELYRYHQSCLDFLVAAIEAQHESSWSPGFASLSRIAVGVPSRAVKAPRRSHSVFSEQALPLFRLPKLQSIYLNDLTLTQEQIDDEDLDFSDTLPPGSASRLKEIVIVDADLEGYNDVVPNLIDTMMSASEGLLHMAFQDGSINGFDLDYILPDEDSQMQSMLFYGGVEVQGYRTKMYDPNTIHTPAFTVDISDVMVCAPLVDRSGYAGNGSRPEEDAVGVWGTSRSQFGEYLFNVFRDRWEAIVFVGEPSEQEVEMIDEGLVRFIRSIGEDRLYEEEEEVEEDEEDMSVERGEEENADGSDGSDSSDEPNDDNHGDNDSTTHTPTRAIYLEGIDYTSLETPRWYAKAIQAGREAGIQVHTRTTPAPRQHAFPFPWPASDKELQTSPFYGHPDLERYLLVPHVGLVMDGCGNCAACSSCLKVMDAAAWAKAHEEEAQYEQMKISEAVARLSVTESQ